MSDHPPEQAGAPEPNRIALPNVSEEVHVLATDTSVARSTPVRTIRLGRTAADDVAVTTQVNDFDTLFAEHYERLVRALSVVAGEPEAAADAVQEAFVKAHLRWRTISQYDDPIGWIRRVAINKIHDGHRRRARKERALLRMANHHETTTRPVEIDEFDRLLATLPKQQRAATALFYVDGLSIAEIAVALDLAEGSVKSHLHDARRRLKPVLEREAAGRDGRSLAREQQEPGRRSPWAR